MFNDRCGHNFAQLNLSSRAQRNLSAPSRLAFIAVVGLNLFCALLALITVKWFLNPLQKQTTLYTNTTIKNVSTLPKTTYLNTTTQDHNATTCSAEGHVEQNNNNITNNYEDNGNDQIIQNNFSANIFRLSLRNWSRPKPLLLIPLTVFNGIEQAFVVLLKRLHKLIKSF